MDRNELKKTIADTLATEKEIARTELVRLLRQTADELDANPGNFTADRLVLFFGTITSYEAALREAEVAVRPSMAWDNKFQTHSFTPPAGVPVKSK